MWKIDNTLRPRPSPDKTTAGRGDRDTGLSGPRRARQAWTGPSGPSVDGACRVSDSSVIALMTQRHINSYERSVKSGGLYIRILQIRYTHETAVSLHISGSRKPQSAHTLSFHSPFPFTTHPTSRKAQESRCIESQTRGYCLLSPSLPCQKRACAQR